MEDKFPLKRADTLDLVIKDNQSVYSNNYQDIYCQAKIGQEEKQHVFIAGNNLPENWYKQTNFTIAETGFGIGLNFLNTLKLWQQTTNTHQHLHYISCELHPLTSEQLEKVLLQFPQLTEQSQQLHQHYPKELFYGFHRLHFRQQNVTLTLIIGDAAFGFGQLKAQVNAWYLDGFAPSKNPELWSTILCEKITRLSKIGTTVATYTVARQIRDKLTAVGFSVTKSTGFGQKREMLRATMQSENKISEKQPWAQTFKAHQAKTYTIIGAGIAGLCLAQKLCEAGKKVVLIDRQKQPCLETSGNPQAMIMPSFTLNDSPESRFYLSAFLYALRHYSGDYYHAVGVLEYGFTKKQKHWQNKFKQKFELPQSLMKPHKQGILYPSSGWLDTQAYAKLVCKRLKKFNFSFQQAHITHIIKEKEHWTLIDSNKQKHTTDCLILANGIGIKKLLPEQDYPLLPKHGQISYFKSTTTDKTIANNPHIQLNKGYITPSWNGIQTMGATFDFIHNHDINAAAKTTEDHWQRNTELWKNTPFYHALINTKSHQARAGIRVTTPDHLPICGAVIDHNHFKKHYHDICHGKHWKSYPSPKPIENLYIFTGLGSRGFTSAPLLAEFLCNQIIGTAQVLDKDMQKTINPNRFLYKKLKKS